MRNTRILLEFARAGIGAADWYDDAARQIRSLARRSPWSARRIAEVTAVFSPRCAVRRNVRLTLHYLETGEVLPGVIVSVRRSLEVYEATGCIHGPKTEPFARALLGDPLAIVLDSWMARALDVHPKDVRNRSVIASASRRVLSVAETLQTSPASVQAAIWTHTRSLYGFKPIPFPLLEEFNR